jgi:inosose dehydratase
LTLQVELGTAPNSWGVWYPSHPDQVKSTVFLDEVVEAGYDLIELGPLGYLPADAARLERELTARDVRLSGGFVMGRLDDDESWDALRAELENTCRLVQALGARFVAVSDGLYRDLVTGEFTGPSRLSDADWDRLVETLRRMAEVAARFECEALLHPHADSHVEAPADVERLLEATAEDGLRLCFDVGHHAYCGGDPVAFVRTHHRRIAYLHLKNVDGATVKRKNAESWPLAKAVGEGVFVEPWLGSVDFCELRDALDEVGYGGIGIVEQDMFPAPPERPLGVARASREYLERIGLGAR